MKLVRTAFLALALITGGSQVTSCANLSGSDALCAVGIVGGGILGAILDDGKGAAIGAGAGALVCAVAKYISKKQLAQIEEKANEALADASPDSEVEEMWVLTGESEDETLPVSFRAEKAQKANDLFEKPDEFASLEEAGIAKNAFCRRATIGVSLKDNQQGESNSIHCLNSEGDYVMISVTPVVVAGESSDSDEDEG